MKIFIAMILTMATSATEANDAPGIIEASQKLLYAVKTGNDHSEWKNSIANATEAEMTNGLATDNLKKAFWLNVYNAYIQILLKEDPSRFNDRSNFFSSALIPIAGKLISLDFIEHGILRRSKIKASMGYVNDFFPSALEKKWRVDKLDQRIHFALNCGAKSCPPVAFYTPDKLDAQLDIATKGFINAECKYDVATNTVTVSRILSWYRGDFGSGKGVRELLVQQNIIPKGVIPKIEYKDYDWDLEVGHYME